jgi:threonine synthase
MKFRSTRRNSPTVSFREAVFRGLAPDGGLYVPVDPPDISPALHGASPAADFREVAARLVEVLLPDEFSGDAAQAVSTESFPFSPRIVPLTERHVLLELFHGPSCAFKDFGASFLATCMERLLSEKQSRALILTATSGDTGSAVAQAFYGKRHIDVVILYPSGRVSPFQEQQLTTFGGNVTAVEVRGSFDDCQRMAKQTFLDAELNAALPLTSANSINLGRLIPQSFYYVFAALADNASGRKAPWFCVPSGNFGNLTAGVYAWKWGMPVSGFIAATNANTVVPEYLVTGEFRPRPSVHTYSNAMDVGDPSNFERLLDLFHHDHASLRDAISGCSTDDRTTLETMTRVFETYGLMVDPHTAVGIYGAEHALAEHPDARVITLATAHPSKFADVVHRATGRRPEPPERLARLMELQKQSVPMSSDQRDLRRFLMDRYGT